MAIIRDTITIDNVGQMPSLGMLIGSYTGSEVFGHIDANSHASFFGSDFNHMRQDFFNRHILPHQKLALDLSRTVNAIMNPDTIRLLTSIEDLKSTPLCMELPILMFEPVRSLFESGRVEGFGYHPDSLPQEDAWGRLIDNFSCTDVAAASDDEGYYPLSGTLRSDDPELSDDELYAIAKTRDFILNKVLKETSRDPTAIDLPRG